MFGLETLNILIGLATLYLVFGIACTAIVEALMVWLNVRSKNLEAGLEEFLDGNLNNDKKFVDAFYAHPLIQSLSQGETGRPSYIPAEIVSHVIETIITANNSSTNIGEAIAALPESRIKGILVPLCKQAHGDVKEFRQSVEKHFNHTMDRASGWLKRRSHNFALIASIILVCGANLDTVTLTNSLAANPEAKLKIVEIAEQRLNTIKDEIPTDNPTSDSLKVVLDAKKSAKSAKATLTEATNNLKSAGVQLGWKNYPRNFPEWISKISGLLISIFAVSLGAPFWFDVLQKFMQVRTAGKSSSHFEKK